MKQICTSLQQPYINITQKHIQKTKCSFFWMLFVCVHLRLTACWTNNTLFYSVYGFNLIKKSKKTVLKRILYKKTNIFCVVHASKHCFEGFVISAGKRLEAKLHVGLVLVRGKSRV